MTEWTCASTQPCKDHMCAIAEGKDTSELGHSSCVSRSHSTDLPSVFPSDIFQGTSKQAWFCEFRKYSFTARTSVGGCGFTFFLINTASHQDVSWSRNILFWWLSCLPYIPNYWGGCQHRRPVNFRHSLLRDISTAIGVVSPWGCQYFINISFQSFIYLISGVLWRMSWKEEQEGCCGL